MGNDSSVIGNSPKDLITAAKEAFSNQERETATNLFKQAREKDPKNWESYYFRK